MAVRLVVDLGWRADQFFRLIWSDGRALKGVSWWSVTAVSFLEGNLVLDGTWGSGVFTVVS